MLTKMTIELSAQNISYNMGSLFHGFLMQNINSSYAEYLHYNQVNPYSSCVYKDHENGNFYWKICTLNTQAYEHIIEPLSIAVESSIFLEHNEKLIETRQIEIEKHSYEELFFGSEKPHRIRLLTPTSYKTDGAYSIFPNIITLFNGVINKINAHSENIKMTDERILQELFSAIYIRDYNLRTLNFDLEKIKIKGFMGTIVPSISKRSDLENLLSFLIKVSEYTGLGIKTSLGMGGVKIEYGKKQEEKSK